MACVLGHRVDHARKETVPSSVGIRGRGRLMRPASRTRARRADRGSGRAAPARSAGAWRAPAAMSRSRRTARPSKSCSRTRTSSSTKIGGLARPPPLRCRPASRAAAGRRRRRLQAGRDAHTTSSAASRLAERDGAFDQAQRPVLLEALEGDRAASPRWTSSVQLSSNGTLTFIPESAVIRITSSKVVTPSASLSDRRTRAALSMPSIPGRVGDLVGVGAARGSGRLDAASHVEYLEYRRCDRAEPGMPAIRRSPRRSAPGSCSRRSTGTLMPRAATWVALSEPAVDDAAGDRCGAPGAGRAPLAARSSQQEGLDPQLDQAR